MIIYYISVISFISVVLTVYDKLAAKSLPRSRIPEKVLLGTALLGGAAAQYVTMRIIRHKTRHKKFMVGLPIFIVIHVIILLSILYFS